MAVPQSSDTLKRQFVVLTVELTPDEAPAIVDGADDFAARSHERDQHQVSWVGVSLNQAVT